MLLLDLCTEYATLRPLCQQAQYLLRRTATLYGEHMRRPATLDDLKDMPVSAWLATIQCADWTRAGHRTRILCLWRFAARRHGISPPGEVRRCPPPEPMPDSWSPEQVGQLLASCRHLNQRAAAWFHATIQTAYESGLRRGDLRAIRREQILPSGEIYLRLGKTASVHVATVRPETALEVLALPGAQPLACPWSAGRYAEYWFRLRLMAGLGSGGLQKLRRTGATQVAAEHGIDAAREFLGHRSAEMVRHYVDRTRAQPRRWLPPKAG